VIRVISKLRNSPLGNQFPRFWAAVRPLWRITATVLTAGKGFQHRVNGVDTFRLSLQQMHTNAPLDWEPDQYQEVMSFLPPGDHFLDIGAFWGLYSLGAARRVGPTGRVMAIEPGPRQNSLLQANVDSNSFGSLITVVEDVCSDSPGQRIDFHVAPKGSMVDSAVAKPGREAKSVARHTTTVDDLVTRYRLHPRLLKIDVEGFEHHVIKGAFETLQRHRPTLFIEFHPEELRMCGTSTAAVLTELGKLGYESPASLPQNPDSIPRGRLFRFSPVNGKYPSHTSSSQAS
jgi:FkbM family methyltransferase